MQTTLGVCVAAVLGWVAYTVQNTSTEVAALRAEMTGLQAQMAIFAGQTTDRYTAGRAATDLAAVNAQISDLRERIRELESLHREPARRQ